MFGMNSVNQAVMNPLFKLRVASGLLGFMIGVNSLHATTPSGDDGHWPSFRGAHAAGVAEREYSSLSPLAVTAEPGQPPLFPHSEPGGNSLSQKASSHL